MRAFDLSQRYVRTGGCYAACAINEERVVDLRKGDFLHRTRWENQRTVTTTSSHVVDASFHCGGFGTELEAVEEEAVPGKIC